MSDSHCIVGFNNVVETLLVVLRRPWCILELWCTKLETVEALYHFAMLAYGIDWRGYAAAVALLSHELSKKREISRSNSTSTGNPTLQEMQDFCTAIFSTSESSFNSFWLRAFCVSSLRFDIAFSEIARCLIRYDKWLAPSSPLLLPGQSDPSTLASKRRNTMTNLITKAKYTGSSALNSQLSPRSPPHFFLPEFQDREG